MLLLLGPPSGRQRRASLLLLAALLLQVGSGSPPGKDQVLTRVLTRVLTVSVRDRGVFTCREVTLVETPLFTITAVWFCWVGLLL